MRIMRVLFNCLLFSSCITIVHVAYAEQKQVPQKSSQHSQQTRKKEPTVAVSEKTQPSHLSQEKRFNRNLAINMLERNAKEENGQAILFSRYNIVNKSQSDMKALNWLIVYTVNGKPVHYQDIKLNFEEPYFKGKQKFNLNVELNFKELSAEAQKAMLTPNAKLDSYIEPRSIVFAKTDFILEVKK